MPPKIGSRCDIESPLESLVNLYFSEINKTYEVPFFGMILDLESNNGNDDFGENDQYGGEVPQLAEKLTCGETRPVVLTEENVTDSSALLKPLFKVRAEQSEFDILKERFAALKR